VSVGAHLLDRCTISRPAPQPDGYAEDDPARGQGWPAVATGEPCRLVVKEQRVGEGVFAERPIVTTYLLLLRARADVRPGDQIESVVLADGTADGATYRIESVLRRRGKATRHISCRLEKIG
jgi:hypothetical protein